MELYQLQNLERDAILYSKEIERMKEIGAVGDSLTWLRSYLENVKAKMANEGYTPNMEREVKTVPWGNGGPPKSMAPESVRVEQTTPVKATSPEPEKRTARNQDHCRSCGQKITWLKTEKGKSIPINGWQRIPGGLWGKALGTHWENCPQSKQWKGNKRR